MLLLDFLNNRFVMIKGQRSRAFSHRETEGSGLKRCADFLRVVCCFLFLFLFLFWWCCVACGNLSSLTRD